MGTENLSDSFDLTRLKTAKRKQKLVKKDFEKKLIKLSKTEKTLWNKSRNLPNVVLEKPYQKGWERSFFLREDIDRLSNADFYRTLLDKINTYQYAPDKTFKKRKSKYRKNVYQEKPHLLKEFSENEWLSSKLELSEKEKKLFERTEVWCIFKKGLKVSYVFKESWRFVLKVKPNIITHKKMVDEILEQEMAEIKNYIENNNLRHRITKLTASYVKYKDYYTFNKKKKHPYKNKSIQQIYQQYIEEKF